LSALKNKLDFDKRAQNKTAVQRFITEPKPDIAEPDAQISEAPNITGALRMLSEEKAPAEPVKDSGPDISAQLEKLASRLDEIAGLAQKDEPGPKYILFNAMEEAVREEVRATMNNVNICKCDKCYYDICALVLNNSPPQYVTSQEGVLFKKASALLSLDTLTKLSAEIFNAISKVKDKPGH